ncbi:hypothetical protein ABMA27_004745 [Loxostege sticticalis]|uniref:THAP-type domain-containing protein n=1 Tax=Loxostege sticticalis TaxID=481309 RepID=A0ABR3HKI3_LOXSC
MRTCSVPHCGSRYGSGVTLHKFPKTEIGLKKWLACINSVKLNGLSVKELQNRYVCQKHFEKRFYTSSHLKTSAYPTLFTQEEMDTGIPALAFEDSENRSVFEHDYTAKPRKRHSDHTYCGPLPLIELQPSEVGTIEPKRNFYADNLKAESNTQYKKLLNEYQKRALKFSKTENFEKLTCNMNPIARKILWMQVHLCTKKTKGRRFTDEEKMIALAIMKQSPRSYKFLRRIFILPSGRTINKLISNLKVDSGINSQIFRAIKTEVENWPEAKKYCSVIFDEVALEPGLSYEKHRDKICGFVELETKSHNYADHALVFMLRGALHKWQQPITFYFCEGATSSLILKNILKEVVAEVVKTGLVPVALISDQGTAFQSALNKLKDDTRRQQIVENKNIDDTIIIEGHVLHVIYDPPHLIKGLRNNFLNKDITYNGKTSKWTDIVDVYKTDCKHAEMRMLHKLNDEHVIPDKIKKMKVTHYVDGTEVSPTLRNTSETVSFFDDLFDSCNGSALSRNKAKPLRQAVTKNSKHHEFWKGAVKRMENTKFIDKNKKECTVPSQKNFVTTIKSLTRLWKFFETKGFKIMRPRYFNSDPIENFFGQVRAYSFRNNDPNCQAFKNIFRSLLITRFIHFHSDTYNCEDAMGDQIIKLKNLFVQSEEERVIPTPLPLSSLHIDELGSPEQNVLEEARRERLNVHSRAYTAGWVVRECLKKVKCVDCKKCLTQKNQSAVHKWISHREFKNFKNNEKLTYPSEDAVRYFSYIVKETNEYLDANPNTNNICEKIYKETSKYSFDFLKCLTHKRAIHQYFVLITSKLCVINWCSIINKILRGVDIARLNKNTITCMQNKALEKYKKKLKNKKLNK